MIKILFSLSFSIIFYSHSYALNILPDSYDAIWFKHLLFLKQEKYIELEKDLRQIVQSIDSDPQKSVLLPDVIFLYTIDNEEVLELLLKWKEASKTKYFPNVMLGYYYHSLAWRHRKYDYASKTPDSKLASFRLYLKKALYFLKVAKEIQTHGISADFKYLSVIFHVDKDIYQKEKLDILKRYPYYYALNSMIAGYSKTKWGGKAGEYRSFLYKRKKFVSKNPILNQLYYEDDMSEIKDLIQQKRYNTALKTLSEIPIEHRYNEWYMRQAFSYFYLKKYDLAIEHFEYAINIDPAIEVWFSSPYNFLAWMYHKKKNFKMALKYSLIDNFIKPKSKTNSSIMLAYSSFMSLGRKKEALQAVKTIFNNQKILTWAEAYIDLTLDLHGVSATKQLVSTMNMEDPESAYVQGVNAYVEFLQNNPKKALELLQKAISKDPTNLYYGVREMFYLGLNKEFGEANKIYKIILKQQGNYHRLHQYRGEYLYLTGDKKEGCLSMLQAMDLQGCPEVKKYADCFSHIENPVQCY